jgi:peptidoglycan hydrolase-like protein with peptidoglycan-binding domain
MPNKQATAELMPNLYIGLTGSDVEKLQQKLQKLNFYGGPIDGLFGLGVEQAVKEYQDSQGFATDGVAGVFVLEALGLLKIERDPESSESDLEPDVERSES